MPGTVSFASVAQHHAQAAELLSLNLSGNGIDDIDPSFTALSSLTELDCSDNELEAGPWVCVLGSLPQLRSLDLRGNPLCGRSQPECCEYWLRRLLPRLEWLNGAGLHEHCHHQKHYHHHHHHQQQQQQQQEQQEVQQQHEGCRVPQPELLAERTAECEALRCKAELLEGQLAELVAEKQRLQQESSSRHDQLKAEWREHLHAVRAQCSAAQQLMQVLMQRHAQQQAVLKQQKQRAGDLEAQLRQSEHQLHALQSEHTQLHQTAERQQQQQQQQQQQHTQGSDATNQGLCPSSFQQQHHHQQQQQPGQHALHPHHLDLQPASSQQALAHNPTQPATLPTSTQGESSHCGSEARPVGPEGQICLITSLRSHHEQLLQAMEARAGAALDAMEWRLGALQLQARLATKAASLHRHAQARELSASYAQSTQLQAAATAAGTRAAQLQASLSSAHSKEQQLHSELSTSCAHAAQLQSELAASHGHREQLQAQLHACTGTVSRLQSELAAAHAREAELGAGLANAACVVEQEREAVRAARACEDKLRQELQEAESRVRGAEREAAKAQVQAKQLERHLGRLDKGRSSDTTVIHGLQEKLDAREAALRAAQRERNSLLALLRSQIKAAGGSQPQISLGSAQHGNCESGSSGIAAPVLQLQGLESGT